VCRELFIQRYADALVGACGIVHPGWPVGRPVLHLRPPIVRFMRTDTNALAFIIRSGVADSPVRRSFERAHAWRT
jgi:hypothetical protein